MCEKEALACLFASEHWHYYLYGRKLRLRTDHKPLTALLNTSGSGRKPLQLQRWHDRFKLYAYECEYKAGSTNCMADLMSRSPPAGQPELAVEDTETTELVSSIFGDVRVPLVSELELVKATAIDPVLGEVAKYIRQGWPKVINSELQPYYAARDVLSLHRECVLHNDTVVVPVTLRET